MNVEREQEREQVAPGQERERERVETERQQEREREHVDPRVEQVRAVRLAFEQDGNRCLWCEERVPPEREGTRVCSEWHAELLEAKREGRATSCPLCPDVATEDWPAAQDFTLSQLRRGATTCSAPHRKLKYKLAKQQGNT